MRVSFARRVTAICLSSLIGAVALFAGTAQAKLGPPHPEADRLWVYLLPQSPIVSGDHYQHHLRISIPKDLVGTPAPTDVRLVVRDRKTMTVIASVDASVFGGEGELPIATARSDYSLKKEALRALKALPAGEYVCALVEGDERISNVAEFTLDPEFDEGERKLLELVAVEAPPFSDVPAVGIRVAGKQDMQAPFRASQVGYALMMIDGVERSPFTEVWGGMNPEIRPGLRWLRIVRIDGNYVPPIEPGVPHQVAAIVGSYETEAITLYADRPLGKAWDAGSPTPSP